MTPPVPRSTLLQEAIEAGWLRAATDLIGATPAELDTERREAARRALDRTWQRAARP